MAELTEEQRRAVAKKFMSENPEVLDPTIFKADIQAAVDSLDTYRNDTAADANNALPATFKAGASNSQKARLSILIDEVRYLGGV